MRTTDHLQRAIFSFFNILILTVPLFFTFNTEELFEFNKMILTYFLTLCISGLWITRMIWHRKIIFRPTKLDVPIMLFVLSQLLSTLFSIHPYTSLLGYYTRFHGGLLSTLSYVTLYYAFVSNIELKQLKGFFITLFAGAGIVSVYGILEHFGHSFSCFLATQGQAFDTACWIQDVKNRVFASFGQPNWLAAYLITLLPLSVFLTHAAQKTHTKWLGIISVGSLLLTLIFTRSRSGILGAAVGLFIFGLVFLYVGWRKDHLRTFKTHTQSWHIWVILGLFLLIFANFETPFFPAFKTLILPKPKQEQPVTPQDTAPPANRLDIGGTDSGEIRKIVWEGAIKVWKRYPILGSGVETFGYSYYQDRPVEHNYVSEWDFLYNKAHNEFLNFLATTGAFGFLSYCFLLISFFFHTTRRMRNAIELDRHQRAILYGSLMAGVVSLTISNFFGFSTVMVTIILFIYFALSELFEAPLLPASQIPKELQNWQYTATVFMAVIGLILTYKIYAYWSADVAFTRGKAMLSQGLLEPGLYELSRAISKNPEEALFYDTLAEQYASYSILFANAGQATDSAELGHRAIQASDLVMELNPRQTNYYKSRARIFINLAQFDPQYLQQAKTTLVQARTLAPTDPKIVYNLGLIELWLGNSKEGISQLQAATALKPDYEVAHWQLIQEYEKENKISEAKAELVYILEHINPDSKQAQDKLASLSAQLK